MLRKRPDRVKHFFHSKDVSKGQRGVNSAPSEEDALGDMEAASGPSLCALVKAWERRTTSIGQGRQSPLLDNLPIGGIYMSNV